MFKVTTNARTVKVMALREDPKIVDGKEVKIKSILFTVASHRKYSTPKKDENNKPIVDGQGNVIKEKQSDFILCKAYGDKADYIHKHCSGKHTVNGVEKTISRYMELSGHLETYKSSRNIMVNQNMEVPSGSGNWYNFNFPATVETDAVILMIDEIGEFLDPKPDGVQPVAKPGVTPTTVTPVAAPTGQTTPVAGQPPVQPPTQTPPITPVQPITQTITPSVTNYTVPGDDITPPLGDGQDFTDPPF